MPVFIVYKTDAQHSYVSRDILGIATNPFSAIDLIASKARAEGFKIDAEQYFNLQNIKQTQGYTGEGEFSFEQVKTDVLL